MATRKRPAGKGTDTRIPRILRDSPTGYFTDALTRLGVGGWMHGVVPVNPKARMIGFAVTARLAPRRGIDKAPYTVYEMIRTFEPGSVLVLEGCGTDTSVFGGNMALQGQVHGLGGMVTDGCCRDYAEMAALRMPVFCQGRTVRLPHDIELVDHGVPITCGGAQVRPGDLVVGDSDGVLVVPASAVEAIEAEVADIARLERRFARAIRAGAPIGRITDILKAKKIPVTGRKPS